MLEFNSPRIFISGVASGVGKSLITLGLLHELRRRGVGVSCCVVGPSLSQALLLKRISGRYVRTLDDRLLSAQQNLQAVMQAGIGSDLILIEGKEGLFDGYGAGITRGSDAEMAMLTRSPVALVADARGFGSSIIAVLKGYDAFSRGLNFAGALLNRVQTSDTPESKDRSYFEATFQSFGLQNTLLGAVPELETAYTLDTRQLSQARNVTSLPRQFFIDAGNAVNQSVDIDRILERAQAAPPLHVDQEFEEPSMRRCRIALSDDSCFNLCFQDNLDLLRHFGAEIVPFSPLADQALPNKIGALYLTGATLNEYAAELAANESMRHSISEFVKNGGIVYAEGAGSAYLAQEFSFQDRPEVYPGVGVLPGRALGQPPQVRYSEAVTMDDTIFGPPGMIAKFVFSAEWHLQSEPRMLKAIRFTGGQSGSFMEGYSPGAQVLATFGFAQFASNPAIAKAFVDSAQVVLGIG